VYFLEKLSLRGWVSAMGLVAMGRKGASREVSVGEMGVEEAIVPPTPMRDVTSGGRRADVGDMLDIGLTRAGLWGEPMDMTKGMLELDAALNLRSGGDGSWVEMWPVVEVTDPVRERSIAGDAGEGEFVALSCSSNAP
jgi:hypothetical protein